MKPHQVVKRPLLSEKASRQKTAAEGEGAVVFFEVHGDANKVEIRKAVEDLFAVKVADVRTVNVRGKVRRVGRFIGQRSGWKKAVVTLAPGSKIEFFEGV